MNETDFERLDLGTKLGSDFPEALKDFPKKLTRLITEGGGAGCMHCAVDEAVSRLGEIADTLMGEALNE